MAEETVTTEQLVEQGNDTKAAIQSLRTQIGTEYAIWFYASDVFLDMKWCGVRCLKSPSDMWNYQEIITELKPSLIVEFGTFQGGATLFFADLLQRLGHKSKVLTVDPTDHGISPMVHTHPLIEQIRGMSVSETVKQRIAAIRLEYPGPMWVILDGDHNAQNVFFELTMLRDLTVTGDYVINEDSNLNGHPVPAMMGCPGPYEALVEYERHYPNDYAHDYIREKKFAFTFAENGFLVRR